MHIDNAEFTHGLGILSPEISPNTSLVAKIDKKIIKLHHLTIVMDKLLIYRSDHKTAR